MYTCAVQVIVCMCVCVCVCVKLAVVHEDVALSGDEANEDVVWR